MTSPTHKVDANTLASMQQSLVAKPDHTELLHGYYEKAVAVGELQQAREFLGRLQEAHPWNHSIRRIRIAIYLQQKDIPAAMDAVETLVAFSTPDDGLIESALAIRSQLGPREIDTRDDAKATISLCMIVRNEQNFLGPCLNSVKASVDEIVIVDTGSEDRSVDIAKIYGAKVVRKEWQDDFSMVRNVSLDNARGDWILILDADEVISERDFDKLRLLATSDGEKKKAYTIQTRNYTNLANAMDWQPNDRSYPEQEAGTGWFPTNKVRLFPNHDAIRFEYPVHEMVDATVEAAGIAVENCSVPVHHYGHLNETKNQRKAEKYFKLGYDKLDQLGNNSVALRELAVQAGQLGLWKKAIELWQQFLAIRPGYYEAYANLAGAHWNIGQYDQGIDFSKKAIQTNPDLKEGHYNLAVNLIMKGMANEALQVLERIVEEDGRYLSARFMLACVFCFVHRHEEGMAAFSALGKEMSPQVLSIALEDLIKKLKTSGRSDYADAVQMAAG